MDKETYATYYNEFVSRVEAARARLATLHPASHEFANLSREIEEDTATLASIHTPETYVPRPTPPEIEATLQTSDENPQPTDIEALPSDEDATNIRRRSDETRRPASNDPTNTRPTSAPTRRKDPRSPLDHLSPDDEEFVLTLIEMIGFTETAERLAENPPRGLNIDTTEASLRRLRNRVRLHEAKLSRLSARQVVENLPPNASNTQIASAILEIRAVEAAHNCSSDHQEIAKVTAIVARLRAAELAERRLALAEKRNA